jgi:flagellar assembly protein FliH
MGDKVLEAKVTPFTFESLGAQFGARKAAPKEEAPPPPPTFTEEELHQKGIESFQKGMAEGKALGRKEAEDKNRAIHEQLTQTMEKALPVIQTMDAKYQIELERIRTQLPKLVLAVSQKVAGKALKAEPMATIEDAIEKSLSVLAQKPEVSVFVHPSLAEALKEKLTAMTAERNIATRFSILTDEAIQPSDMRLEWRDGGITTNTQQMWDAIEKMLEETLQG